jgi:hypothetical protein
MKRPAKRSKKKRSKKKRASPNVHVAWVTVNPNAVMKILDRMRVNVTLTGPAPRGGINLRPLVYKDDRLVSTLSGSGFVFPARITVAPGSMSTYFSMMFVRQLSDDDVLAIGRADLGLSLQPGNYLLCIITDTDAIPQRPNTIPQEGCVAFKIFGLY